MCCNRRRCNHLRHVLVRLQPPFRAQRRSELLQWGPGLFGTPKNLKLHFWTDFRVFVTMGNPIIGRNFGFYKMQIFKKRKIFGEKIEKSKIASQDFKLCPWATQSPNMSFQLPLGSKIIARQIWSRDFLGVSRVLNHLQWDIHWKWLRSGRDSQILPDFRLQICPAIIFDPRGSWKLIFGDYVAQGHSLKSW